ncbi:phage regulatory CII family protein [uncultured Martelella sp.]|uniref:phage regulatory CII family protein n=1 Tax=uncultured Martelella sp. TaxID=392331 RepID=UPI0029C77F67|nr:phage regulatory CII family protein [uncultured Martelella sp.]
MQISEAFHHRIKAAQRDLIERCGGIERTASKVDFSKSQVGRWNSPADGEHMPVAAIVTLEADCGLPLVTAVLAEANGRRLSDPEAERAAEASIMKANAEVMRAASEFANSMALAIADGKVTPSEAQTCDRQAAAMEKVLSEMRRALAMVKAHGGEKAELRVVSDGEA